MSGLAIGFVVGLVLAEGQAFRWLQDDRNIFLLEKVFYFVGFLAAGEKIYRKACMDCHGEAGEGIPPHYPPLSGNRALTMDEAVNPIRIVLNGGFAPGTSGNPRPYGMPPFSHSLNDLEVAQVVSYLRSAWGNNAPPVSSVDVNRYRNVPLD